jgi:hypothetical protein
MKCSISYEEKVINTILYLSHNLCLIAAGKSSLCNTIPLKYLHELGWEKGNELVVIMNKKNRRLMVEEIPEEQENNSTISISVSP